MTETKTKLRSDSIDELAIAARNSTSYERAKKYATYLFEHGHYSRESGLSTFASLVKYVAGEIENRTNQKSRLLRTLLIRQGSPKKFSSSIQHEVAELLTAQFEREVGWEEFRRIRDQKLNKYNNDYKTQMNIRREILESNKTTKTPAELEKEVQEVLGKSPAPARDR